VGLELEAEKGRVALLEARLVDEIEAAEAASAAAAAAAAAEHATVTATTSAAGADTRPLLDST